METEKPKMGCGQKIGIGAVLGLVGLWALGSSVDDPPEPSNDDTPTALVGSAARDAELGGVAQPTPSSNWIHSEEKDELRGTTDKFASITSENTVDFDFPYAGGSSLRMTVRRTAQYGQDIILNISSGQFVCGVYDCSGMISIDGKTEKLTLSRPEDHDSETLFATYPDGLIRKLKGSQKVIVELPFYQEGNRQFTFETAGLQWD